jgi:hypothetical protein
MPACPSRFRQRSQIQDGSTKSHATTPSPVDCGVPVLQAYNESPVLALRAPTEAEAIKSYVDEEAAIIEKPFDTNTDKEKTLSKSPVHIPSFRDTPRSQTPNCRLTPILINDQDSQNGPEEVQHRSELERISRSKREASFATTTMIERASGRIKELSSTRKRRLPVHALALLRTTTLEGLPSPSVRNFYRCHSGKAVTS